MREDDIDEIAEMVAGRVWQQMIDLKYISGQLLLYREQIVTMLSAAAGAGLKIAEAMKMRN